MNQDQHNTNFQVWSFDYTADSNTKETSKLFKTAILEVPTSDPNQSIRVGIIGINSINIDNTDALQKTNKYYLRAAKSAAKQLRELHNVNSVIVISDIGLASCEIKPNKTNIVEYFEKFQQINAKNTNQIFCTPKNSDFPINKTKKLASISSPFNDFESTDPVIDAWISNESPEYSETNSPIISFYIEGKIPFIYNSTGNKKISILNLKFKYCNVIKKYYVDTRDILSGIPISSEFNSNEVFPKKNKEKKEKK